MPCAPQPASATTNRDGDLASGAGKHGANQPGPVSASSATGECALVTASPARANHSSGSTTESMRKTFHEALSAVPVTDAARNGTVVGVLREGYMIGDELLRAAGVAVGRSG